MNLEEIIKQAVKEVFQTPKSSRVLGADWSDPTDMSRSEDEIYGRPDINKETVGEFTEEKYRVGAEQVVVKKLKELQNQLDEISRMASTWGFDISNQLDRYYSILDDAKDKVLKGWTNPK